jgi:hypothetical protein
VGDFLATLAIVESGGSTVKAASFPVETEKLEGDSEDPALESALTAWEGKRPPKDKGLRKVRLELGGGRHDLTVGYLAETPVWRPSYRVVVGEGGKAQLQAWGIIQNLSGEDWENVQVSLVAGAPIAFESTLGEPVIPHRPVITDQGEVIAAVPESSTTLKDVEAAPPAAAPAEEMMDLAESDDAGGYGAGAAKSPERAPSRFAKKKEVAAPRSIAGVGRLREGVQGAAVFAQTGSTRYEVSHTITVPDKSATMVLLVSKDVPGAAVHLYAPDYGVPDSQRHPFRVLRFENSSGGLLEKGPIAVFEKGAFLGQGMMDSLPDGAKTTVPFALVRSLAIEISHESDYRDSRLYSIENGEITVEQDYAQITHYHVQNGEKEAVKLVVKHPRQQSAKLVSPTTGVEEDLAASVALISFDVKANHRHDFPVEERYAMQRQVSASSSEARAAIAQFLKAPGITASDRVILEKILALVSSLEGRHARERILVREQQELEKSTRETRLSIEAIEKNTKAADLRAELTERLRKGTARLDEITKELIELRLRVGEEEIRLRAALHGITIHPPDRRK